MPGHGGSNASRLEVSGVERVPGGLAAYVGGGESALVDCAMAAALRVAARVRPSDGPVVALLADSWDRYTSKPWMV